MNQFRQALHAKASNWAVCLLSASLIAVAVSNWSRPTPVAAQASGTAPRRQMTGESKAVLNALQDAFVNIAETVEPGVVTISARSNVNERPGAPMQDRGDNGPDLDDIPAPFRDFFRSPRGGGRSPMLRPSTGSGVIIKESGNTVYVLTNNHVVDGRDKFRVQLYDKSEHVGELVGKDERTDLAVLKFTVKRPLPAGSVASLGNSDDVKVGQWAVAIGSPLGYESTLTVGVISAKGRELGGVGAGAANYVDLLQTDASINPGNSGGPLVNIDGDVIGINVAIAAGMGNQGNIGIGFAIPANTAKMVADQLISRGRVTRGYLGVAVSPANRELSTELRDHLNVPEGGALCETVQADAPAGRAGLKNLDVIVKFGDRPVRSFTDLEKAVAATRPNTTVPVEVVRDGKPVRLNIHVVERPSEEALAKSLNSDEAPTRKAPVSQPVKTKYGLSVRPSEDGAGVEVVSVAPGSPAGEAGIRPGDVITQVDRTPTPNVGAFQRAVDVLAANDSTVLRVKTPNGTQLVLVRP